MEETEHIDVPEDAKDKFVGSVFNTMTLISDRIGNIVVELDVKSRNQFSDEDNEEEDDDFYDEDDTPEYVLEIEALMNAFKTMSEIVISR